MTLIEEFIEQWQDEDNLEGILLTGSYAMNLQTKTSDIDFRILMSKEHNNPKKITEVVEGKTFSYMIGNYDFFEVMMKQQFHYNIKAEARNFHIGTIIVEKTKSLTSLKNIAKNYIEKSFLSLNTDTFNKFEYEIYQLQEKYTKKEIYFKQLEYYVDLKRIFDIYNEFLGNEKIIDIGKLDKILNDQHYRNIYFYSLFIDNDFLETWKNSEDAKVYEYSKKILNLLDYIKYKMKIKHKEEFIINPY